jgi:AbiV family abortive infection protein
MAATAWNVRRWTANCDEFDTPVSPASHLMLHHPYLQRPVLNRMFAIDVVQSAHSSEWAEGMNAAARSAKRLCEDAEILMAAKRFPSACAMAILSIEESGKRSVLRELACATNKARINAAWRRFGDHREKNAPWIMIELALKGARTLDELSPCFDRQSDHPDLLNSVKQLCFYADCYGDAHWSEPHEVIDEKLAGTIVGIAKTLVPIGEVTEREVELWVRLVGPHWGKPSMKRAAFDYQMALQAEGLCDLPPDAVREFYGFETA